MGFIDTYSWRLFLSSAAKNIQSENNIHSWEIKGNKQTVFSREITESDLNYLEKLIPFNFFYLDKKQIDLLKKIGQVKTSKDPNTMIQIAEKINLPGHKYGGVRHSINCAKKYNLSIENNLKQLDDVNKMLDVWKETSGLRHFQVRIGKDKFFFKNQFYKDCLTLFFYDQNDLVAYSILSPPINGYSSYILGKALCLKYRGLSEFADIITYENAWQNGVRYVNLGGGGKKLRQYKMKFPGAIGMESYDGKISVR